MTNDKTTLLALLMAALLSACMAPSDTGSISTDLRVVPASTTPLARISGDSWRSAGDCFGRLPTVVEFQIARGGLLVALDALGNVICAGTVDGIRTELEHDGRLEESEALGFSYLVSTGVAIPDDMAAGDPSPQPSTNEIDHGSANTPDPKGTEGIGQGDPSPQPSSQPDMDEAGG